MHVTISWDISASDNRWSEINDMMKNKLKGYSWVKPLNSVYVVKVDSLEDRIELKDALIGAIKSVDEKVHLLITPAMEGGAYSGWLPKGLWEKLNLRTK